MKRQKKKNRKFMKRSDAKDHMSYRSMSVRAGEPSTLDEKDRSVEVVIATDTSVEVFDFERYEIINEILLIDGMELSGARQVPLLDTHNRFDTASVLGSVRDIAKGKTQATGRAIFSGVEDVEATWQKVREGHLTDFSVGYKPIASQWVPEGETYDYKGRSFKGPVRVTKRWKIREVSIVPIGADELAKARSAEKNHNKSTTKESANMNKKLLEFLISRGLSEDATEEQAWEFLRTLQKVEPKTEPPEDDDTKREAQENLDKIRAKATGKERDRYVEIDAMGQRWELVDLSNKCIVEGKTVEESRAIFMDHLHKNKEDIFEYRAPATVTQDSKDKFRSAAVDSLLTRSSIEYTPEKLAPGHEDLMGYSLKELARESLRQAGESDRGSTMEMIGRALATDDLPYILANVANKSLFQGWETAEETWKVWCGTGSVSDFKTHYLPRASETSDLDEIPEHGEYKHGKITEAQESYSVVTYGKLFAITRQTIINDDLGALTNIPSMHGQSASRKVGDVVYAVLTANAAMGDAIALFDASTHANYVAHGSGAAPGNATIAAGILAMGVQKDLQGLRRLNIRPVYLIAPRALEGGTEVFLTSFQYADSDTVATDSSLAATRQNPYAGSYFTRVYESRLDDNDAAAWFLAAQKGKTVNAFFLNGIEIPYLESKSGWSVDGTEYKVRIDVGAKAVDWKGLYQNDGN